MGLAANSLSCQSRALACAVFEGVPGRGIYDNMKTAVDRVGVGKRRDVNARFLSMTSHYVFEPEFCNPAAGGIVDGATWGPGAEDALARADSGTFLETRGALLVTGPTGTNVMDLLVAVKDPA